MTCPPAFSEKIYYPGVSFGEPGSGPGQFKEPVGVAVNDVTGLQAGEGDVYVVDSGNDRVERFSSSGVYLGQFNGSGTYEVEGKEVKHGAAAPSGTFQEPEQIAVDNCTNQLLGTTCTTAEDPSVGDVYVTDKGHKAVDKFSATGEYLGQLTEMKVCRNRSAPCEVVAFSQLGGLAVDSAGNLWVEEAFPEYEPIEKKHFLPFYMDEFSSSGVPERAVAGYDKEFGRGGMVVEPNGDFDVISLDGQLVHAEVQVFEVAGEAREELSHSSIGLGYDTTALAIVPSTSDQLPRDVLADYGGSSLLYAPIVEREQQPLEAFPGETVPKGFEGLSGSDGLAVNASATVYASEYGADRIEIFEHASVPHVITEPPSGVSETALTLHGSVNPGGEAIEKCYFEYGTEAGKYTGTVACKQSPGAVNESVPVEVELSDLAPAQARIFQLVAVNKASIAKGGGRITITRPTTTGEAVSEVGSSSAKVSAMIDGGGLVTCYWFEFGTSTSYGGETAKSCVGPGEDEKAKVELLELQPNTVYHFRIQARNQLGAKAGEDRLFTTFPASSAGLPDERVYEAVSPVAIGDETNVYVPEGMMGTLDKFGHHGIVTDSPFQAATSGEAVAYVGDAPNVGGNGDVGDGGGNQYVAGRSSDGGWTEIDVNSSGYANDYVALSDDLSVGVVVSSEKLAEDAPVEAGTGKAYSDLYGRSLGWRATAAGPPEPAFGLFEPLIAATPPCPVAEFGSTLSNKLATAPLFGAGNAGTPGVATFSHLLIEADVALPSTPATATPRSCGAGGEFEDDLYDSVEGQLYLVNVLPDGRPQAGATIGRQGLSPNGARSPDTSNAVSADGSRIYWSAVEPVEASGAGEGAEERPTALYVRENDTDPEGEHGECGEFVACTVEVDAAEAGCSEAVCGKGSERGGRGQFWTATADGSRVFFTDERSLTNDATAGPGAPDLYEYDLEAPEGERLSDLSVPAGSGPGVHADLQGIVGASEDGSYVYFVADGVLSEGANAEGGEPAPGEPNLYVRHGGVTRFIATLSEEDGDFTPGPQANYGDWQAGPGHRTAQVAADGQSVVFMSRLPLTGYDNELDRVPLTEVFVYDAATERLTCASCNPSGEPPVAPALPEFAEHISEIWGAFLPASDSLASYQPRVISEDGDRVFFDSIEPLVPQDENGFLGVYEWERDGTGSCEQASGCIFLLSGGQSNENSYLIDASANGDDVFFVSRAQLVKADHGDDDVLYDARVGGVEPPAEVECSGAGCQGQPSAPPLFATPASATFVGPGNPPSGPPPPVSKPKALTRAQKLAKALVACRKGPKRKRHACTTQARKRYTPLHKAKKASHTPSKRSGR